MSVDRCVCFDVPFTRILAMAQGGKTLEQVRAETGCGTRCGLCRPYTDVVLATGRTVLPVMSEEVCRAIIAKRSQG